LRRQERSRCCAFLPRSVDDGKSTLIGRLLYDTKLLFEDHLAHWRRTPRSRHTGGDIDFALLVDGLEPSASKHHHRCRLRFFATDKRKFIVADTPGHEQYTAQHGDRRVELRTRVI